MQDNSTFVMLMLKWINAYKFRLLAVLLVVWMLFFDSNSLLEQWKRIAEINRLKEERNYYLKQTELTRLEQEQLFSDMEALERFARERYMMKRENEDIFILREKD